MTFGNRIRGLVVNNNQPGSSTGGNTVAVVDSVDDLDPNASIGTIAAVKNFIDVERSVKLTELSYPTYDDIEDGYIKDADQYKRITGIDFNTGVTDNAGEYYSVWLNERNYCFSGGKGLNSCVKIQPYMNETGGSIYVQYYPNFGSEYDYSEWMWNRTTGDGINVTFNKYSVYVSGRLETTSNDEATAMSELKKIFDEHDYILVDPIDYTIVGGSWDNYGEFALMDKYVLAKTMLTEEAGKDIYIKGDKWSKLAIDTIKESEIVDSVDELDPNAPIGTIAAVKNAYSELSKFTNINILSSDDINSDGSISNISNYQQITGLTLDTNIAAEWNDEVYVYLVNKDFATSLNCQSGKSIIINIEACYRWGSSSITIYAKELDFDNNIFKIGHITWSKNPNSNPYTPIFSSASIAHYSDYDCSYEISSTNVDESTFMNEINQLINDNYIIAADYSAVNTSNQTVEFSAIDKHVWPIVTINNGTDIYIKGDEWSKLAILTDDSGSGITTVTSSFDLDPNAPFGSVAVVAPEANRITSFKDMYFANANDHENGDPDSGAYTFNANYSLLHNISVKNVTREALSKLNPNSNFYIKLLPVSYPLTEAGKYIICITVYSYGYVYFAVLDISKNFDVVASDSLSWWNGDEYCIDNEAVDILNYYLNDINSYYVCDGSYGGPYTDEQLALADLVLSPNAIDFQTLASTNGVVPQAKLYINNEGWNPIATQSYVRSEINNALSYKQNAKRLEPANNWPVLTPYNHCMCSENGTYDNGIFGVYVDGLQDTQNILTTYSFELITSSNTGISNIRLYDHITEGPLTILWENCSAPTFKSDTRYLFTFINGLGMYREFPLD